jgi:hypothetical protein
MLTSMARGWESKAVESQQEDRVSARPTTPPRSPVERARAERAQTVALALADATAQLQAACRPAQRDALRQRVVALEALLVQVRSGDDTAPD